MVSMYGFPRNSCYSGTFIFQIKIIKNLFTKYDVRRKIK
jgi:hypothetical protein